MKIFLTFISCLLLAFGAMGQVKVNQFTTNKTGVPILGSFAVNGGVTSTNFVGLGANLTNLLGGSLFSAVGGQGIFSNGATEVSFSTRGVGSGGATVQAAANSNATLRAISLTGSRFIEIIANQSAGLLPFGYWISQASAGGEGYAALKFTTNRNASEAGGFNYDDGAFYVTNGFRFAGNGSGITNMNPTNLFISGSTIQSNNIASGVVDEARGLRDYAGNLVTTWGWYFTNDPPGAMFTNRDTLVFYKTNNMNPYTSVVTAHLGFLSMNRTNGYVGIGTNDPRYPFIAQASGNVIYLDANGFTFMGSGGGSANFSASGAVGSFSGNVGYVTTLADYEDDNETDINLETHVLADSAGSKPYWTVEGEIFGGFATISHVSDGAIALLDGDYTNRWTIDYTNYAGALTINEADTNRAIVIATAGNYLINMYSSFQGPGGASHLYECSVFTNANGGTPTECPIIEWKRLTSTSDTGTAAAHGIIYLEAGGEVRTYIRDNGASGTVTINKFNLTVTPAN